MKTCEEWSTEFDFLYQNITSNQAPGLTEYEKSVFLTREQEADVVMLYKGTFGDSFEETEELTHYLSALVSQEECTREGCNMPHVVIGSEIFILPDDLLFRTLEMCRIDVPGCGEKDVVVIPVTQDEYWRTSRNPFKGANENKVLRLTYGDAEAFGDNAYRNQYSEIISKYPVVSYSVRYVRRPDPIILVDLSEEDKSINGQTGPKTCALPELLHQTILTGAVKAAKAAWQL